jgi:Carboxypeptidase regulatory-like domain
MNNNFTNKGKALLFMLAFAFMLAGFNLTVSAQYSSALDANGGDLTVTASYTLSGKQRSAIVPQVVDPNAFYSNITTFTGQGILNGGATLVAGNTITQLVADDLTFTRGVPVNVVQYRFTVLNNNAVAVSFRPRIRFYNNNAGVPGTLIGGNTFNAVSVPALTVQTFTSPAVGPFAFATQTAWAGITFDNNSGATGATATQLNNLGQGVFNPPDRGTSADLAFRTTTAGDFLVSNPAGATFNTAAIIDNFGWELMSAPPTAASVSIGGRVMTADGTGIAKTIVTITDSNGSVQNAVTNGFGYYRFDNISVGDTYIISAANKRYTFSEPQKVMFVSESNDNVNFIAQQ